MSYLFSALIILGYLLVVYKIKLGFGVQLLGCLGMIFLYYGVDGGVVLVNSVFVVINILGFIKWKKEGEVIMEGDQELVG